VIELQWRRAARKQLRTLLETVKGRVEAAL